MTTPPRRRPAATASGLYVPNKRDRLRPHPGLRSRRRIRQEINWTAVTSLITALTAIGALVFTGLSLNATRDQIAIAQAQSLIAQQGHITDRYTKAVEQLDKAGADHLQGRLGAIYALERLARDSRRDQPTIIDMLSAFIRTTTPPKTNGNCPDYPPAPDVQAALTVLARRDAEWDNGSRLDTDRDAVLFLLDARLDLHGVCLRHARLRAFQSQFSHANFSGADISGAYLFGTNFHDTDFSDTNLSGADLGHVIFSHTDLRRANLSGVDLTSLTQKTPSRYFTEGAVKDNKTKGAWW